MYIVMDFSERGKYKGTYIERRNARNRILYVSRYAQRWYYYYDENTPEELFFYDTHANMFLSYPRREVLACM